MITTRLFHNGILGSHYKGWHRYVGIKNEDVHDTDLSES